MELRIRKAPFIAALSFTSGRTESQALPPAQTLKAGAVEMFTSARLTSPISAITKFNPTVVSHGVLTQEAVLQEARSVGLSEREIIQLKARLDRMTPEERSAELSFLKKEVLHSANADRALNTYLALAKIKDQHPQRITGEVMHMLTRGVAKRRASSSAGAEGVFGQRQALDAAHAMTTMSQADYDNLQQTLRQSGNRNALTTQNRDSVGAFSHPAGSGAPSSPAGSTSGAAAAVAAAMFSIRKDIPGYILTEKPYSTKPTLPLSEINDPVAAAQTEQGLILKAVAARKDSFTNSSTDSSSSAMSEITTYAGEIRGRTERALIDSSTVLDLRDDGRAGGLQQRFKDSCAPTTAQIARAEVDPIYAWKLHQEAVHSKNASQSEIAREQRELLALGGGIAVPRHPSNPREVLKHAIFESKGVPAVGTERILDSHVGPSSHINYKLNVVADSTTNRTNALNQIAELVEQGIDVPIAVAWNGGGGHVMLITDVRGSGDNQRFLVTDPFDGTSTWITRKAIVDGNTTFIPGNQGRLNEFFSPDVDYGALGIRAKLW